MGVIMHNNIPYGGGSSIEPNPQESATDQLETLGIDGDVYEVTDANAIHTSDVGVANGVAELDANGFVPSSQLPSYVDDVLEYASRSAFPATGETGKIYVALDTNLTYRWGGSDYVEISPSLALGETSSTAYRGDRGKIAYDHSQSDHSGIKPAFTEASTRANIASGETIATIFGKIKKFFSDLKTVAFTGAYSDLSGTPTIPTVNNGTLTIQKNGTAVETFTANSSTNKTANITVPTGDLASINKDGTSSTKYLRGDGTWQSALELQGRVYGSGDDEGLVIKANTDTNWASMTLLNSTGRHSTIAMQGGNSTDPPFWRYNDGTTNFNVNHPAKAGTMALTSDLSSYLPLSGGTMTGNLLVKHAGDTYVQATNTTTGNTVYLDSGSSINHGVYSAGYYTGSSFVNDGKWMLYRDGNGGVILNGNAQNDGDGNTISSTYAKKPLYATGSVSSGKTGVQKIAQITLSEVGTYYITGWAKFTGGGKKAVQLWCAGTLGESWEDSTIATGEPKTFSTFAIYTSTVANEDVKVNSYTVSASNAVTGGIVAFKIA